MRLTMSVCALAFVVGSVSPVIGQSQGPNIPTMAVSDPSVGIVPWEIPGNCLLGDPCVATVGVGMDGGVSHYLKATAFGFTLPDGAVIHGIQVDLDRFGVGVWDQAARIVKTGSIGVADRSYLGGGYNGNPNGTWYPQAIVQYGGPNDLWGETWTAATINDDDFGFALSTLLSGPADNGIGSISSITITVFYSLCGNIPDAQCDDGNVLDGDCCSATCQYEPLGSPCADDGNVCTDNVCDGAGTCIAQFNSGSCDDGIFCNGSDTCSGGTCSHAGDPCLTGPFCASSCNEVGDNCFRPANTPCPADGDPCTIDTCDGSGECGQLPTGCKTASRSVLLIRNNATDDAKDTLIWKWLKGAETMLSDLGSPTSTTNYTLCLYAGTASASVALPAGANWRTGGRRGFNFSDPSGTPDGGQKAALRSGASGQAKALLKGKGINLPDTLAPTLPLPVTAQLVNDTNNTCFEAVYNVATRNNSKRLNAKMH